MTVRLYLGNDTYPPITANTPTGWSSTTGVVLRALGATKVGVAASVAASETSTSGAWAQLLGQWVSDPFLRGGTLQGQFTMVVGVLESAIAANFYSRVRIIICSGDGTTNRMAYDSGAGLIGTEWTTTATARTITDTIPAIAVTAGERIRLELGFNATNTSSTSYTGTAYYGGTDATDLVSGNTGTLLAARCPHITFADAGAGTLFVAPPTGGGGDLPATIPGLDAWWRADSLTQADNSEVASWPDSSGNGHTATQVIAANRPLFRTGVLNGRPVLRFNASDIMASTASSSLPAQTLFTVVKHGDGAIVPLRATSGDGGIIFQLRNGIMAWSAQNTGIRRDGGDTNGQVFQILSASLNSTDSAFYTNGSANGTGQGLSPTAGRTTLIGADPTEPTEVLIGDLAELLVYNRVLSGAERAQVHSYLSDKYAITVADYVAPPDPTQTISPAGIPSAEAFGTPSVVAAPVTVAHGGVPSAEAFGAPQLQLTVSPAGIGSGEAFGTPTVTVGGVIAPLGIPSGEAFGVPTLVSGPVSVAATGIPSAEVVPAPKVVLVVAPVGIPSAEAFGVSALTVSAVAVQAAGIPSAETFGLPTIVASAVSVGPTGIPSGEAVGVPRLTFTVYAAGIPSAETFGTPLLVPLPVSVLLTGIPSGEAFGFFEVTVTLVLGTRIGLRRPRLTPLYEVLVMARRNQASGPPMLTDVDAIEWSTLRWASTVSRAQAQTITCERSSITEPVRQHLRDPHRSPIELWMLRNGSIVAAGPLLGGAPAGNSLRLEAGGLMTYLDWMIVEQTMRFDQADQFVIAAALIDQWQNNAAPDATHGHFGIDTSQVGTSGRMRDQTYEHAETHYVGKRIEELGARLDGFDAEINPSSRALQLWYPRKGVDRSAGEDAVVFDSRNIDGGDGLFALGPGDLASDAFGSGSSSGSETTLWSAQPNLDLRTAFGRTAITGSWSDVSEQATLDDHVKALRDARDQPLRAPGRKVRVTPDSDLSSYDVGDTVQYELDELLGIGGPFRIRSRAVSVDPSGQEAVDLEFV